MFQNTVTAVLARATVSTHIGGLQKRKKMTGLNINTDFFPPHLEMIFHDVKILIPLRGDRAAAELTLI